MRFLFLMKNKLPVIAIIPLIIFFFLLKPSSNPYTAGLKVLASENVGVGYTGPTPSLTITPSSTPSSTLSPTPTPMPVITITNPQNGAKVKVGSRVNITAVVSEAPLGVNFYVYKNSALVKTCADSASPYECAWKVPSGRRVQYLIKAVANLVGGSSVNTSITVTSQ